MRHREVVKHFGSASEAARRIGISRAAVSLWKDRGIPHYMQLHIELLTRKRLKASNGKR